MINLWLANTKQLFLSIHMRLNSGKYFKHQFSNNQSIFVIVKIEK